MAWRFYGLLGGVEVHDGLTGSHAGGDGKYKSIGLFPSEKEAAMAVDDYLYKTFPEKYAAFRANFPRNADGTCDVSGVPGPPPGGPPL